jgi:two-component system KDP operon response regulator KdpE
MKIQQLILLVEDDAEIRHFVRVALEAAGYRVHEASECRRGLVDAAARRPDLVLLDLGLPDADGMEFLRGLRAWSPAPVIVLSARNDEGAKVAALDLGADDYLTKPFSVNELLARVRAALRRRSTTEQGSVLQFGEIVVDMSKQSVLRQGVPVKLTAIEYRLLELLARNAGALLTHRRILQEVWGPNALDSQHYVRVYMGRLRHKLEHEPARPRHLLTESGAGYRLVL